jgi:hypothetical protein
MSELKEKVEAWGAVEKVLTNAGPFFAGTWTPSVSGYRKTPC